MSLSCSLTGWAAEPLVRWSAPSPPHRPPAGHFLKRQRRSRRRPKPKQTKARVRQKDTLALGLGASKPPNQVRDQCSMRLMHVIDIVGYRALGLLATRPSVAGAFP